MDRTLQQDNTRVHSVEPISKTRLDPRVAAQAARDKSLADQGVIKYPSNITNPKDAQLAFDMMVKAPLEVGLTTAMAPSILPKLYSLYTNPVTQTLFAVDGIRNAVGNTGVKKTVDHIKNEEYGQAALSGTVDVLDILGIADVVKGVKAIKGVSDLNKLGFASLAQLDPYGASKLGFDDLASAKESTATQYLNFDPAKAVSELPPSSIVDNLKKFETVNQLQFDKLQNINKNLRYNKRIDYSNISDNGIEFYKNLLDRGFEVNPENIHTLNDLSPNDVSKYLELYELDYINYDDKRSTINKMIADYDNIINRINENKIKQQRWVDMGFKADTFDDRLYDRLTADKFKILEGLPAAMKNHFARFDWVEQMSEESLAKIKAIDPKHLVEVTAISDLLKHTDKYDDYLTALTKNPDLSFNNYLIHADRPNTLKFISDPNNNELLDRFPNLIHKVEHLSDDDIELIKSVNPRYPWELSNLLKSLPNKNSPKFKDYVEGRFYDNGVYEPSADYNAIKNIPGFNMLAESDSFSAALEFLKTDNAEDKLKLFQEHHFPRDFLKFKWDDLQKLINSDKWDRVRDIDENSNITNILENLKNSSPNDDHKLLELDPNQYNFWKTSRFNPFWNDGSLKVSDDILQNATADDVRRLNEEINVHSNAELLLYLDAKNIKLLPNKIDNLPNEKINEYLTASQTTQDKYNRLHSMLNRVNGDELFDNLDKLDIPAIEKYKLQTGADYFYLDDALAASSFAHIPEAPLIHRHVPSDINKTLNTYLAYRDRPKNTTMNVATGSKHNNLKVLQYLQERLPQYDLGDINEISNSTEQTNKLVNKILKRNNTVTRGVSKQLLDGFDNHEAAAEYMLTSIPHDTGGGRYGLDLDAADQTTAKLLGIDIFDNGLYTSNSINTAKQYTRGDGYIGILQKPLVPSPRVDIDYIDSNITPYTINTGHSQGGSHYDPATKKTYLYPITGLFKDSWRQGSKNPHAHYVFTGNVGDKPLELKKMFRFKDDGRHYGPGLDQRSYTKGLTMASMIPILYLNNRNE